MRLLEEVVCLPALPAREVNERLGRNRPLLPHSPSINWAWVTKVECQLQGSQHLPSAIHQTALPFLNSAPIQEHTSAETANRTGTSNLLR